MIPIKTEREILAMRQVCSVAAEILDLVCQKVAIGVSTYDLDQYAKKMMEERGVKSACYNYQVGNKRFPGYTCLSVNNEVVHGIGSLGSVLKEGDIVTVDVCVELNGFVGDNARTVPVGSVSQSSSKLLAVTKEALERGIAEAKPGKRLGDVSSAIQRHVESNGFSVIRDFVGHGIGKSLHEEPQIPNFGRPGTGPKLLPGMTLAIEPMVNAGDFRVRYEEDGWTVVTTDGSNSAHFEHTVLIKDQEPAEILTLVKKNAC